MCAVGPLFHSERERAYMSGIYTKMFTCIHLFVDFAFLVCLYVGRHLKVLSDQNSDLAGHFQKRNISTYIFADLLRDTLF